MRTRLDRTGWMLLAFGAVVLPDSAAAQPPTAPPTPAVAAAPAAGPDAQARLAEVQVELAWLDDPLTLPHALSARVQGSCLEVFGYVPDKVVQARALAVAREHTTLAVRDALNITPGMPPVTPGTTTEVLQRAATAALLQALPQAGQELTVEARADGQVTLSGTVASFEDRLRASQAMRRVRGCTSVANRLSVQALPVGDKTFVRISADGRHMVPSEELKRATNVVSQPGTASRSLPLTVSLGRPQAEPPIPPGGLVRIRYTETGPAGDPPPSPNGVTLLTPVPLESMPVLVTLPGGSSSGRTAVEPAPAPLSPPENSTAKGSTPSPTTVKVEPVPPKLVEAEEGKPTTATAVGDQWQPFVAPPRPVVAGAPKPPYLDPVSGSPSATESAGPTVSAPVVPRVTPAPQPSAQVSAAPTAPSPATSEVTVSAEPPLPIADPPAAGPTDPTSDLGAIKPPPSAPRTVAAPPPATEPERGPAVVQTSEPERGPAVVQTSESSSASPSASLVPTPATDPPAIPTTSSPATSTPVAAAASMPAATTASMPATSQVSVAPVQPVGMARLAGPISPATPPGQLPAHWSGYGVATRQGVPAPAPPSNAAAPAASNATMPRPGAPVKPFRVPPARRVAPPAPPHDPEPDPPSPGFTPK